MNEHQKLYKIQELLDEVWGEITYLSQEQEDQLADIINNLRKFREELAQKTEVKI